jgi:hypothetical protein
MYVYIQSEKTLWSVGFYDPSGNWIPEDEYQCRTCSIREIEALRLMMPVSSNPAGT